jgi:hypothetical protein
MKDVQSIGEAISHQERTSRTSKHEISSLFLFLWVILALQDPDPDLADKIKADLQLTITLTAFRRFAIRSGAKTMHSMQRAHKGVSTKRQKESMSPSRPFVL